MRVKSVKQKRRDCRLLLIVVTFLLGLILILHYTSHRSYSNPFQSEAFRAIELKTTPVEIPETTPAPTRTQFLKKLLNCKDRPLLRETVQYGEYWLLRNYVRGTSSTNMGCAESITYTTNGDFTFFGNIPEIVTRWQAPISFAIYAPGYDMNTTVESMLYVRNCLPESALIREFVTFHVFFPAKHMPAYVPIAESELLDADYDCDVQVPPYEDVDHNCIYRSISNLTYPINVGRNVARKAANTYFIFACDVELYPSSDLVDQFLDLVERNQSVIFGGEAPRVFPLPVFEIAATAAVPESKQALIKMLRSKKAVPFHSKLCKNCHLVPNQTEWLNTTDAEELRLFSSTRREGKFQNWEPFYISDNKEPYFDERVTWEGQSNKRIQGYAMCLLGYEYHVLDPVFLVHTPGIKVFNAKSPRLKYVGPMNKLIKKTIIPEYKILYGQNEKCRV